MAETTKFHPAIAVNNVKNFIHIILDMENSQYNSWATLFKIHARAYQVIDHIIPPPNDKAKEAPKSDKKTSKDPELWDRLDAIVLQWIYGTISNDVLHSILHPNDCVLDAWNRLAELFQDNKGAQAVHLENEFFHVDLNDFPNTSAYCQRIKMLADQLGNVGGPVTNQRMLLQLVAGLNEAYKGVATLIQQSDPLPTFAKAGSMLTLEESASAKRAPRESNSTQNTNLLMIFKEVHNNLAFLIITEETTPTKEEAAVEVITIIV